MESGTLPCLPQRIWTVDIHAHPGKVIAVCRACGPLRNGDEPGPPLRTTALRHLARHARCDPTPAHLHTCQCGRRGCPWHARHRGCSGPILLALTRDAGAGTWRLADLCHQCYSTTPHTAAVPHHAPSATADRPNSAAGQAAEDDEEQPLTWETSCPSCGGTCGWTDCPLP